MRKGHRRLTICGKPLKCAHRDMVKNITSAPLETPQHKAGEDEDIAHVLHSLAVTPYPAPKVHLAPPQFAPPYQTLTRKPTYT